MVTSSGIFLANISLNADNVDTAAKYTNVLAEFNMQRLVHENSLGTTQIFAYDHTDEY
jgi:hypothetical protein